jgi:hypothetical protein
MARPIKDGCDYFPLDVRDDDKLLYIEAKHGFISKAIINTLWQKIYERGCYMEWNQREQWILQNRAGIDSEKMTSILLDCLEVGLFDETLFNRHKILTSRGIQKRYFKIKDRKTKFVASTIPAEYMLIEIEKKALKNQQNDTKTDCVKNESKTVNTELTPVNTVITPVNAVIMQQRKEKKSKDSNLDKSKSESSKKITEKSCDNSPCSEEEKVVEKPPDDLIDFECEEMKIALRKREATWQRNKENGIRATDFKNLGEVASNLADSFRARNKLYEPVMERLQGHGLTRKRVEDIASSFPHDYIENVLERCETYISKGNIENVVRYLLKAFRKPVQVTSSS